MEGCGAVVSAADDCSGPVGTDVLRLSVKGGWAVAAVGVVTASEAGVSISGVEGVGVAVVLTISVVPWCKLSS